MNRRDRNNLAARHYWQRQANAFRAQGLTTRGTPRKYRQWPVPGLPRRVRERIERRELALRGLTSRGNPRRPVKFGGGVDRNARLRLRTAALNALSLSARGRTKPVTLAS